MKEIQCNLGLEYMAHDADVGALNSPPPPFTSNPSKNMTKGLSRRAKPSICHLGEAT